MSRGIDIKCIDYVICYDVSNNCMTMIHRFGRTGRYGSHGSSITFVDDDKSSKLMK